MGCIPIYLPWPDMATPALPPDFAVPLDMTPPTCRKDYVNGAACYATQTNVTYCFPNDPLGQRAQQLLYCVYSAEYSTCLAECSPGDGGRDPYFDHATCLQCIGGCNDLGCATSGDGGVCEAQFSACN